MEDTEQVEQQQQFQTFEDNDALLQHLLSQEPDEKLVDVPEWKTQILCRALNAEDRIKVEMAAYDDTDKSTDYRRCFYLIVSKGCYNPANGTPFFKPEHEEIFMKKKDGGPIGRLALAVLRLSRMLASGREDVKKN